MLSLSLPPLSQRYAPPPTTPTHIMTTLDRFSFMTQIRHLTPPPPLDWLIILLSASIVPDLIGVLFIVERYKGGLLGVGVIKKLMGKKLVHTKSRTRYDNILAARLGNISKDGSMFLGVN